MKNHTHPHEHHLTYHCHQGVTGEYIGQVVEYPDVIVHASTKEKLKEEILDALNAYLEAFPEQHEKLSTTKTKTDIEKIVINT
jgi:predicted RNase H-like HicB family nuclease